MSPGPIIRCCLIFGVAQICFASNTISKTNLQSHVEYLSSNALAGRLTGSRGEKLAMQYVANRFSQLGLEPAGDQGTFFQAFKFTAGVTLGKNNLLRITDAQGRQQSLKLNLDWRPLSFSDSISFDAKIVFAGYGIKAAHDHFSYDSYRGLNVKDKWVVVLRYMPEKISEEQRRWISQFASLRYKVLTAKAQGAKGIIFVSGPNAKVKNELIPFSFEPALAGSGVAVVTVRDEIIDSLLKSSNPLMSLKCLQDQLDVGQTPEMPELNGISLSGAIDVKPIKKQGLNVLAKLVVAQNTLQTLVVGAHADHLGRGEVDNLVSLSEKGLIHAGADDNASGVASVLEVARALRHLQEKGKLHGNKNILFAIWSGEELGLLGSNHFVKTYLSHGSSQSLHTLIDAYINLDMVGRFRKHLLLQGLGSSPLWSKLINRVGGQKELSILKQNDPYLPTDSTSFYLQGVPTINFFTGSHGEYHSSRDTPATLNYEGMKRISAYLLNLILELETQAKSLAFQQVSKPSDHSNTGFRVYLGTIPDYASHVVSGVKLMGVTKGSPAAHAGLRGQDIIVKLAGKNIHDIYDYTYVLRALPIGKPVLMVVRRQDKNIRLNIIAQSRE